MYGRSGGGSPGHSLPAKTADMSENPAPFPEVGTSAKDFLENLFAECSAVDFRVPHFKPALRCAIVAIEMHPGLRAGEADLRFWDAKAEQEI